MSLTDTAGPVTRVRVEPTEAQQKLLEKLTKKTGSYLQTFENGASLNARLASFVHVPGVGQLNIPYQVPFMLVASIKVAQGKSGAWYAYIKARVRVDPPRPSMTKEAAAKKHRAGVAKGQKKAAVARRAARVASGRERARANREKLQEEAYVRRLGKGTGIVPRAVAGVLPMKLTPLGEATKGKKGGWVQPYWYKTNKVVIDVNDKRLPWED